MQVLKLGHCGLFSGHQDVTKTLDRVTSNFYLPGVHGDVTRFCDVCQKTVAKGKISKVPLEKMPVIDSPFERVAVDLIGPIHHATSVGFSCQKHPRPSVIYKLKHLMM